MLGFFGTTASSISDIALLCVLSSAVFGTIAYYFLHYKKRPFMHMVFMVIGVLLLWLFLLLYLLNYYLNGVKTFGGPSELKLIYYPFLIIHIIGSMIMGILTAYQMVSGLRRFKPKEEKEWAKFKFEIEYKKRHRSWGKKAVILWWFSAISGLIVYIFLYVLYSPEMFIYT
ncbi:MAG: DUF420 domain-containing protein [Candidatus Thorarchaeota archaeon]